MIPEVELYQLAVPAFGLVTVAFAIWTLRLPNRIRSYGLAVTAFAAMMTLGYGLMSQEILTFAVEDGTTAFGRFVGYIVAFSIIYTVMWALADGSVGAYVALLIGHVSFIGATIVSWATGGSTALAARLSIFAAFFLILFVLLGPLSRQAGDVSGERRLLFGKLRNLVVLTLIMYLVVAILTDSGAGVLDTFVGVFMGIYVDVLLVVGWSAILLRSRTALEHLVDDDDGGADPDVTIGDPAGTPAE